MRQWTVPIGHPHARAISAARINLNLTRRAHATVEGSSTCRPFELAASGAAIVSNPHAGIERWFEPGNELVVVDDTETALATYHELLDDPARRAEMGRRGRQRVESELAWEHQKGAYVAVFDELVGRSSASGRPVVPPQRQPVSERTPVKG